MLIFQNLAISFVPDKSIYNPIFKQSSLSVWIVTSIKKIYAISSGMDNETQPHCINE